MRFSRGDIGMTGDAQFEGLFRKKRQLIGRMRIMAAQAQPAACRSVDEFLRECGGIMAGKAKFRHICGQQPGAL
jgi:hypothetical protein